MPADVSTVEDSRAARRWWMKAIANDPDGLPGLEDWLRWHGGPGHFVRAGQHMVALYRQAVASDQEQRRAAGGGRPAKTDDDQGSRNG
jgi:hypothetical protein